jgi:subtilisin family serine protease
MFIIPAALALGSLFLSAADESRSVGPFTVTDLPGHTVVRVNPSETPAQEYIVEFHGAPLAARGMQTMAAGAPNYRATFERFRDDLDALGGRRLDGVPRLRHEYFRTFHGVSTVLEPHEVEAVRQLSYVKAVHRDTVVSAFSHDTDRISRIGADRFWSERNSRGEGIVIAVIDSGVDYNHGSLGSGFGPSFKVIGGFDFVDDDHDPMDENGHGTHVAGIIAGEGEGVFGVAPASRLLAYRVLDRDGWGKESDIIAALERMIDPNQDGDLSDRVDVANLSLGGSGDAHSPSSIAVDNAVAAGVVVVLAAGNDGRGQSIGSPAAARLGITVGSSDMEDRISLYSSRGPSFPDLELKPEIVAPGTSIESARAGGGLLVASGTSMAAPHVAGAAALLLSVHPEWTPARVKGALVGRADPVSGEVMAQGGGRLNVYEAGRATVLAEPAVVSFGNGPNRGWSATRTVTLANHGSSSQTFSASYAGDPGVVMTADPETFVLAPGATQDVTVSATVSGEAEGSAVTSALGGQLTFASDRELIRVPWVAIDAGNVRLIYDSPGHIAMATWRCGLHAAPDARRDGNIWNALLPYRPCDLMISAFRDGDLTMLLEAHEISEDVQLRRSLNDSPHELRLAGVDDTGAVIAPELSEEAPYYRTYAFSYAGADRYTFTFTSANPGLLKINTLPSSTTINTEQTFFDFPNQKIVTINHRPIKGIESSMTMTTLPGDLIRAGVQIMPHDGDFQLRGLHGSSMDGMMLGFSWGSGPSLRNGWRGDVFVTAPADDQRFFSAPALMVQRNQSSGAAIAMLTPGFRVVGTRVALSNEPIPSPASYGVEAGETIMIGTSPVHASSFVELRDTAFAVHPSFSGPAGESVLSAREAYDYEIRDASNTIVRSGSGRGAVVADFGERGSYRATVRTPGVELDVAFDTSRADSNPPALTSLRIVDQKGHVRNRFSRGSSATLVFSVADYIASADENRGRYSEEISFVRAAWRVGNGTWHDLPLELVTEDRDDPPRQRGTGLHYRSDLGAADASGGSRFDLRIEMSDRSGNTSTVTLNDAFSFSSRQRLVRR